MVICINTEQIKPFSTSAFTEIHLEALRGCRINRQYSPLCACPFYALSETNPHTHTNRKLIHFRHPFVSVLFLWKQCIANRVLVPISQRACTQRLRSWTGVSRLVKRACKAAAKRN
jgi:hypothetical protein